MIRTNLLMLLLCTSTAFAQTRVPSPLEAELPTLDRQSSWRQDVRRGDAGARRGVFPVGNGRVAAYVGTGARANTLLGLGTPLTIELEGTEGVLALPAQRIRRVRGESCVITEDGGDEIVLRTLTVAHDEALWRVVEVTGDAAGPLRLTSGDARLSIDFTSLPFRAAFSIDARGVVAAVPLESAVEAARQSRAAWRERLRRGTQYRTDHAKLDDLLEGWRIDVEAMLCPRSGLVAPPGSEAVSVRDNNGALLLLLRFGLQEEAEALLRHVERAVRTLGRVPETITRDLDSAPADEFDWRDVPVPASEIPSWIILQHYWYWRATRDIALIDDHWLLLDVCLKKQARGVDDLLPFHGGEPYLGGSLYQLPPESFGDAPALIANDPARGRHALSLASSTLFLLATQALGELAAARRLHRDPTVDPEAVSAPYQHRMFRLMQDLERRYWLADAAMFAPALSPVDLRPHDAPCANANLMPLWAGWTYPSGERSRDNLAATLARLWRDGVRIGTSPRVGHATGDLQGMLLVALAERDGVRCRDVLDSVLALAEPAGEWPAIVQPDGTAPPGPRGPEPAIGGINVDAILFAILGLRQVCVPSWDKRDIRLEFRMPHGARTFVVDEVAKDGRHLAIRLDEAMHLMSADEVDANAELPEEKQRDPNVRHRRLHFEVELLDGESPQGHWDVAVRGGSTMFVRYLTRTPQPDGRDLSRIEEADYVDPDPNEFLGEPVAWSPRLPERPPGATTLLLTTRRRSLEMLGKDGVTVVDTGLPFTPESLAALLHEHERVVLDWGYDAASPMSFAPHRWSTRPPWTNALARFEAAGGVVVRPRFLTPVGGSVEPEPDGMIPLDSSSRRLRFELDVDEPCRAVVHLGGDRDMSVRIDDRELGRHSAGIRAPDRTSIVTELASGTRVLECEITEPGPGGAYVRVTDARGLPVDGVRPRR